MTSVFSKKCLLVWAIGLLVAQTAFGQNYARYCARDTDQLANDLTNAITSQDENYIATLYYWAGFSAEAGYRKMDDFYRMTQRTLISVDPIGSGGANRPRKPRVTWLSAGIGQVSEPPPVEETPEIGPYIPEDDDPRGLGQLPKLPVDDVPIAETPIADGIDYGSDDVIAESRRKADEFDRQLQRELDAMAERDGWQASVDAESGYGIPARAIRVEQEEGRIRPKKVFTTFGIIKYEECYWLTGG